MSRVPFVLNIDEIAARAPVAEGVSPLIHPNDFLFRYLLKPEAIVSEYLRSGLESAGYLSALLPEFLPSAQHKQPVSLLEFASGYGMVSRHIARIMPYVELTCCDIHEEAVSFIQEQIGANAVVSHRVPECLDLGRTFDAVFALSFFSHMPDATWGRWLRRLVDHTTGGGIVIFTTHGSEILRHTPHLTKGEPLIDGYWFAPLSEQGDLDSSEYGTAITTEEYVRKQLADLPIALLAFREAFWWGHQDLYILRKM